MAAPSYPSQNSTGVSPASIASSRKLQDLLFQNYSNMARYLQPLNVAAQMKQVGALYPEYRGKVLPDAQLRQQATGDVRSMMDPLLQRIRATYQQRGNAGTAAISGLTEQYTQRMQDWANQVQAQGAQAVQAEGGINASLADFTRNRNASLQEGLNQALQGINASPGLTAATAGQTGDLGNTAAVNTAALGQANTEQMLANTTALSQLAQAQPGLAAQQGVQQLGQFQSGLNQLMSQDLGQAEASMPQMVQAVYQSLLDRQQHGQDLGFQADQARAAALTGYRSDLNQLNLNRQLAASGVAENAARLSQQDVSNQQNLAAQMFNTIYGNATDQSIAQLSSDTQLTLAREGVASNERLAAKGDMTQKELQAGQQAHDRWVTKYNAAVQKDIAAANNLTDLQKQKMLQDPGTDPAKRASIAGAAVRDQVWNDPRYGAGTVDPLTGAVKRDPASVRKSWAWNHPAAAIKQLEANIRIYGQGDIPQAIVHNMALNLMQTLGLRLALDPKKATIKKNTAADKAAKGTEQTSGPSSPPAVSGQSPGPYLPWWLQGLRDIPQAQGGLLAKLLSDIFTGSAPAATTGSGANGGGGGFGG